MPSYVGLDVSPAETNVCVLDGIGRVRFGGKVRSCCNDLGACIREHAADAERVCLETGQTAGTLFRGLKAADLPVFCL